MILRFYNNNFFSRFLILSPHRLIKFYILLKILNALFQFLNLGQTNIVFTFWLIVIYDNLLITHFCIPSQFKNFIIFLIKKVIYFLDFFLCIWDDLLISFLKILKLISNLILESVKLWLSYKTLNHTLKFRYFII